MLSEIATIPLQFDTPLAGEIFFIGRLLFGATLAFMGLNHFMDLDAMAGYAEFKGLPAPRFSVVASGLLLVLGGLGVVVGAYPVLAAGGLAVFLLVSAVTMHDFCWPSVGPLGRTVSASVSFKGVAVSEPRLSRTF